MRQIMLIFTLLSLLAILMLAFSQAPSFTASLTTVARYYVDQTFQQIGVTNVVSAVTFDWRGFDTFGEATLLFTAAVGIRLILRNWLQRRRATGRA
jgi:multisubunit Na+/H+ antiporter MnhB subunit